MSDQQYDEIDHPLESVFDLEEGSTLLPARKKRDDVPCNSEVYDNKDSEIEKQMQEVYNCAMDAYEAQTEEVETVEGRYRARNGEIAVQFLQTALNAAKEKSSIKQHKDKMAVEQNKSTTPGTVHNNMIVADRNDILRSILNGSTDS